MPSRLGDLDNLRHHVEPSENSSFGIIAMDLCRFLPDWWDQDLDPSELSAYGEDLLEMAIRLGRRPACESLVQKGFELNQSLGSWDESPIGRAIVSGNMDIVAWVLANDADPNLATEAWSLLCLAAGTGPDFIQAMLDAGANPNIHCSDSTWGCAIGMVAYEGSTSGVKVLIEAGADVNPKFSNPSRKSPLAIAIEGALTFDAKRRVKSLGCAHLLLENGADANAPMESSRRRRGYDSMLEAALAGYLPDLARLLVEYGADVKTPLKCQGFDTILEYAVERGDVDFTQLLITRGADGHSRLKIGKHGSLLVAACLAPESSVDMVRFLIEKAHVILDQLQWKAPPAVQDERMERTLANASGDDWTVPIIRDKEISIYQEMSKTERAR